MANTVLVNENVPCDQHWGKSVETNENILSRTYFAEVNDYLMLM